MGEGQIPPEVLEEMQRQAQQQKQQESETPNAEKTPEQISSFVERSRAVHEALMEELIRPIKEQARQAKELLQTDLSIENFELLFEAHETSGYTALSKAELNQLHQFLQEYILEMDPTYKSQYQRILARLQTIIDQTKSDLED